jgi:hypothetical protein
MITETDEIAEGLELAALTWPSDQSSRTELLRHIIAAGIQVLEAEHREKRAQRMAAVAELSSGKYNHIWPEGYLEELRSEWPE